MAHKRSLIRALPLIARALGDKHGVKVIFGRSEVAYTDGKNIYLPELPLEDEGLEVLANGFIDHEAAHLRYTDFTVQRSPGLHKSLTNVIEDLRIEQAMGHRYPGSRVNLKRLSRQLVANGYWEPVPSDIAPQEIIMAAALYCGRADILKQEALFDYADQAEAVFRKELGEGAGVKFRALLGRSSNLGTTQEAADLAREIMAMLEDEAKKQEEEASTPKSEESKAPDDAQSGSDSGDGTQSADDDPSADGAGEKGPSDASKDPDADSGKPNQSAGSSDGDTHEDGDGAKTAAKIRKALAAGGDDVSSGDLGDMISDQIGQRSVEARYEGKLPHRVADTIDIVLGRNGPGIDPSRVRAQTTALRTRLAGKLEAQTRRRRYAAQTGRRIMGHRIPRVVTGDMRIYERRTETRGVDTAVQLLIDRSGSMSGRIALAYEALVATTLALEPLKGVKVATAAFPGVLPLTRFNESVRQTLKRYQAYTTGSTPLAESMLWCAHELAAVEHPRKILFVITDGSPNEPEQAQEVIRRLSASGVEVLGLGIGTMAVKTLFPSSQVIQDISELPSAVLRILDSRLVSVAA